MGLSTWCAAEVDTTRQAHPECFHRKLQWQVQGRMPECTLVPHPGACQGDYQPVASGL